MAGDKVEFKYYMVFKPYGMLSQFSQEMEGQITLANLNYKFDKDIYPVGRLDSDSEGLLLLTNDKRLNKKILDPLSKHEKTYWIQVERNPSDEALKSLEKGVEIRIKKKKYLTLPAKVKRLKNQEPFPARIPPVRYRATIPTTWIEIKILEGKNRQVRRMMAKVGFPVLRLVRVGFFHFFLGHSNLKDFGPGEVKQIFL